MTYLSTKATISPCRKFRYDLRRIWNVNLPWCLWIMLNPSTADSARDDRTIMKCVRFSQKFGYGGLYVVNLFALRSREPQALYSAIDPIGPLNDKYILKWAKIFPDVIGGWGIHGKINGRGKQVAKMLISHGITLKMLAVTKDNEPGHPLYLSKSLQLQNWSPNV